jgi:nucleotide-binding universal stress UspA family protein
MKNDKRIDYETRDSILKLLTDQEIARVSTAETEAHLSEGDEYLDLEQLTRGVRRAGRPGEEAAIMGRILPRKAVQEDTWAKILAQLGKSIDGAPGSSAKSNGTLLEGTSPAVERFVLLAAVDDSDAALEVVSAAAGFARLIRGAEVHMLYVLENPDPYDSIAAMPADEQKVAFDNGRMRLEDLGREARARVSTRIAAHFAIGTAWREIVQTAANLRADLILVGTHDRKGIASAILGSVAQVVARKAPCPVLVVRPKKSRHQEIPEIEPPCADCERAQTESGGKELWCARHRQHHARAHCHYEVPESFGLGSMLIRD